MNNSVLLKFRSSEDALRFATEAALHMTQNPEADPVDLLYATSTAEAIGVAGPSALERTAVEALGVLVKTPHIVAYLAKYDPQAFRQARDAYYAFDDADEPAAGEEVLP